LTNLPIYFKITPNVGKMNNIDKKILHILQGNGHITNAELAKKMGGSPPPWWHIKNQNFLRSVPLKKGDQVPYITG